MVTIVTSPQQELGRRIQIRGFPKIWTGNLTFDEIAWFLFDLLSKYGPIDSISVTQSKKDLAIYGMVDMLHEKDALRIMEELLDQNNHYTIKDWKESLSFRQINPNAAPTKAKGNPMNNKASEMTLPPPPSASNVSKFNDKICPQPKQSIKNPSVSVNDPTRIVYSREQLMELGNLTKPMKQEGLDPQFEHILRGANNENINNSNNNKYKNREEMANRRKNHNFPPNKS